MVQLLPDSSLGFLLTDLARLYRQAFEKAVEDAGLSVTPGEIRALAFVARFPGSRQAMLAERMGVEPMTLSAYLDRLEIHGLIRRTIDPTDRRAKIITTTDAAVNVFNHARPIAFDVYRHAIGSISMDEVKTAESVLMRMRANLTCDPLMATGVFEEKACPASIGLKAEKIA